MTEEIFRSWPMAVVKQEYEEMNLKELNLPELQRYYSYVNTKRLSQIPEKSRQKYEIALTRLEEWCCETKIDIKTMNEEKLLRFFEEKSVEFKPSTLWAIFSMLKTMLYIKYKIDIKRYTDIVTLLNHKSQGYTKRTSRIFTNTEITRFLLEADDHKCLFMKVTLIIGLSGGCTKGDLANLRVDDLIYHDNLVEITIRETKSDPARYFSIGRGKIKGINLIEIIKKYANLRPADIGIDRFFIQYQNGRCIRQPVGINIFGTTPKKIAKFLGLPKAEDFTGRCFKKSATVLSESVADLLMSGGPGTNVETIVVKPEYVDPLNIFEDEKEALNSSVYSNVNASADIMASAVDVNASANMVSAVDVNASTDMVSAVDVNASTDMVSAVDVNARAVMVSEVLDPTEVSQVPEKSRQKYEVAYSKFEKWRKEHQIDTVDESVLLEFFQEMSVDFKSSTLWTLYSILKTMLNIKYQLDIGTYHNLLALLNFKAEGYQPRKSRAFTREEITRFMVEADDYKYLFMKVALIIGLSGACTKGQLTNLRVQDLTYHDNFIEITTQETKTDPSRHFVVTPGNIKGVNLIEIVKKYASLRPADITIDRFFIQYLKGRCTRQPVGINIFGTTPKKIAEYLGLPGSEEFTGRSFKSSSAMLAESVVDLLTSNRL